jgi:hypothetical protein|tara:strand:+ start:829 stop:939 length:111 start_codon:yes stop_codon:yes gene_type:complete
MGAKSNIFSLGKNLKRSFYWLIVEYKVSGLNGKINT